MYIYDTAALLYALTLPLDADLRRLLRQRADHLATLDRAVADATYYLIVDATATLAELEAELGWSPLIDLDGAKFGDDAFHPFHDFCADRGGWFELMFAVSNEAVVVLLVQDDERVDLNLLLLCRGFSSGNPTEDRWLGGEQPLSSEAVERSGSIDIKRLRPD